MTKKYTIAIIIILLAVAILGSLLVWHWVRDVSPEDMKGAVMEANAYDAAGVELTSAFTLSFADAVSSTAVRRCLQVQPEIEVGVHQGTSRQQVLVVPAEPLAPDTLYTFVLSDDGLAKSWAFQTGNQVAVTAFSPADRSTEVKGSSLSVTFDRLLDADLAAIDNYFSIEPQVDGEFSQSGRSLTFTAAEGFQPGTVYQVSFKAGLPFTDTAAVLAEDLSFAFETQGVDNAWQLSGAAVWSSVSQPRFVLQTSDGTPLRGGVSAQLYALSEDDYTNLWTQILTRQPAWSQGFAALSNCQFNGALLEEFSLSLEADGSFILPQPLKNGCYMLRVTRGGSSRDLPFMVSGLAVAALNHNADLLAWVHIVKSGQRAEKAEVRDLLSGQLVMADNQGVAQLIGVGEDALLRVNAGGQRLILPCWQGREESTGTLLWRYLYLSQDSYRVGDTLSFWGLVQPRDASPLEYDAVSVYLFDANDQPVLRQYTPLDNYFFSGELELPALPDGLYRLAVWQSGRELISRSFALGAVAPEVLLDWSEADPATAALPSLASVSLDAEQYRRGDSFAASCALGEGDYLFLEASAAGVRWSAGSRDLYAATFQPLSKLDSYCRVLHYADGFYTSSDSALLRRDPADCRLLVSAEPSQEDEGSYTLCVTDSTGVPVSGAQLLVCLSEGRQLELDLADVIYGDLCGSGWVGEPVPLHQPTASGCGQCRDFCVLHCDSEGRAEYSCTDAGRGETGSLYMQVQALAHYIPSADAAHTNVVGSDTQEVVVLAGSLTVPLRGAEQAPDDEQSEQEEASAQDEQEAEVGENGDRTEDVTDAAEALPPIGYSGQADLVDGIFTGDGTDSLLLVTSPRCSEVLLRVGGLLQDDSVLAQAAGLSLLHRAGGELTERLLEPVMEQGKYSVSDYQQQNGSMLDDLHATAAVALLDDPALSAHTLRLYCQSIVSTQPPGPDYAAALAALTALGQPQLNDVRRLLALQDGDIISRYWLVIAAALSGDGCAADFLPEEPSLTDSQAEEWALCSLASSCCGDFYRALSSLDRALELVDEQAASQNDRTVLICAAALARLLQNGPLLADGRDEPYDLTYRVGSKEFHTAFEPDSLFQLPLNGFGGELQIVETEGGFSLFTRRDGQEE